MTDDIDALVAQIENQTRQALQRVRARGGEQFVQPIEPGLGTVTVLGTGELAAVDLDRGGIKRSTGSALAAAVLDAVRKAEERANG
jgi:DNA-binding protein YbaB